MKALLICPADRPAVARLAEPAPLAALPFLGKSLVEYWLEHLATRGAKIVLIVTSDHPSHLRAIVGDGARWGICAEIIPESRELSVSEARVRYCDGDSDHWLALPDDAVLMDHLPGLPEIKLFESYANWFAALQAWRPRTATPDRIGLREISPGVWLGLHARVAPSAQLRAPCWIGANVSIGPDAVIGPEAIVEDRVVVEAGARILHSAIAPETFVGRLTLIKDSLACGPLLINWKTSSCLRVPDAFLLCTFNECRRITQPASWLGRLAAMLAMIASAPLAL
ncbi:MAG: hypothetical protein KGJ37_06385, partial [Verrucomicrobiota bacterium]|nr:hypothetical protein [Verrucomicrobiota bacterium]